MAPYRQHHEMRILLVDDCAADQQLVSSVLQDSEYPVTLTVVEDAPSALQLLQEEPFDILLLDLRLPGMQGMDLLEKLQKEPAVHELITIVLTGSENPDDVAACYELGAHSYLVKPSDVAIYRRHIATMIEYWSDLATHPRAGV